MNGDDPEAVVYVAGLAFEYRQRFKQDVVIDMVCYRRWGHNEGDEPSYTQPIMYRKIKGHTSVAQLYGEQLVREGVVTREELDALWAAKKAESSARATAGPLASHRPPRARGARADVDASRECGPARRRSCRPGHVPDGLRGPPEAASPS